MKARSRSDEALAEAVTRETGLRTTPWQIERWRQGGLLQPGDRFYPGSGSETTYSPETKAQAVELANLSRQYRRQRDLALALFGKDMYVSEPVLKRALIGVFERADTWIGPAETDDELDDMDHRAQRMARWAKRSKQGRVLQRRMRGRAARPEAMVEGVYYGLLHILKTGEPTSEDGFNELLDATGLRGLFSEQLNGAGPIAPEGPASLQAFLKQFTLQGVAERVQNSSMDELCESRDLMAIMFPFFRNFAIAARRLPGSANGPRADDAGTPGGRRCESGNLGSNWAHDPAAHADRWSAAATQYGPPIRRLVRGFRPACPAGPAGGGAGDASRRSGLLGRVAGGAADHDPGGRPQSGRVPTRWRRWESSTGHAASGCGARVGR